LLFYLLTLFNPFDRCSDGARKQRAANERCNNENTSMENGGWRMQSVWRRQSSAAFDWPTPVLKRQRTGAVQNLAVHEHPAQYTRRSPRVAASGNYPPSCRSNLSKRAVHPSGNTLLLAHSSSCCLRWELLACTGQQSTTRPGQNKRSPLPRHLPAHLTRPRSLPLMAPRLPACRVTRRHMPIGGFPITHWPNATRWCCWIKRRLIRRGA
jgi:hypothetical protein